MRIAAALSMISAIARIGIGKPLVPATPHSHSGKHTARRRGLCSMQPYSADSPAYLAESHNATESLIEVKAE